jgi:hypothetical protein
MARDLVMDRVHTALFTTGYPYVDAAIRATELAGRHHGGFSRSIGEPFSLKRDQFVRWFLETDASHVLMLEGDVVPPEDALDRLLAVDAPVATAVYPQWLDDRVCSNVQTTADASWSPTVPAARVDIRRCLLGCVLIRREVLAAIKPPWFLSTIAADRYVGDDEWFCSAVARAGYSIACDGTLTCASFRQGSDLLKLSGGQLQRT